MSLFFPPLSSMHGVWENSRAGGFQCPSTHPKLASFSERKKKSALESARECKRMAALLPVPGSPCESACVVCVCVGMILLWFSHESA